MKSVEKLTQSDIWIIFDNAVCGDDIPTALGLYSSIASRGFLLPIFNVCWREI